jgi:pyrimidine-nucleoside phosphorylase
MIPAELIKKKRAGKELSSNEISSFIQGYLKGEVADYQMSALLMAIYFQGLTKIECWNLTQAMLHSGSVVKFGDESNLKRPRRVDKHSTGGVGDKTSLVIAPISACAGIQVPMISGRGLGHTGGTLDKLESIPGFNVNLSEREFTKQVKDLGVCFIGQTQDICPADKKMYALRDVTGTVESIPLICSSIMSKKLAEGIDGLVMDIKAGSGAFMKSRSDAMRLARAINEVGKLGGKKVSTLITNMSQPLGFAVGNMLEVQECLEILSGKGADDLRELCLHLAGQMIYLGGKAKSATKGYSSAQEILDSGAALALFKKVVSAQGGKLERLSPAPNT